jgi:AAA domain
MDEPVFEELPPARHVAANGRLSRSECIALASAVDAGNVALPPFVEKLIRAAPESFYDQRAGQIAVTVRDMRSSGEPVNMAIIGNKHLEFLTFISTELARASLPLEAAEFYAEKTWQEYQVRLARSIGEDLIQSLESSPDSAKAACEAARFALDTLATETSSGLPEIVDAAAFMDAPQETPPELIRGILHRGSKLALGGSSKAYKSWLLLDMAVSVGHGRPWLGLDTVQGKVLFINFEIQPYAWQKRITAVCSAKGIALAPGQIALWNLRGHAADFRQLIPKIIERARLEGFALIIFDPAYKIYGATDENAAGDVAALLNSLERLAVQTGAAVCYGCHFAKGNASGKEAIDRISGSGVFARDPDSLLIFTKHDEPDAFTVDPILRNFAPVQPFVVRWHFPLFEFADDLDPSKLKQAVGKKKEHDPVKLLAAIASNDELNPISMPQWAERTEIPRTTLNDYVTEMRRKGWVKIIGEGSKAKQAITNKGKEIIQ